MRSSLLRRSVRVLVIFVGILLLAVVLIPKITPYKLAVVWGESVDASFALAGPVSEKDLVQGVYVAMTWSGVDPNNIPHLKKGATLVKRIACAPGQHLRVTPSEARCDGLLIGLVRNISLAGLPLAPALFDGLVPDKMYFLVGDHPASYDSRYLGLIPFEWVAARLVMKV